MKKVGLYFGSFNPIHNGHLALGNYFARHTDLNEVWFVVSPQNPFKVGNVILEDHHRLEMVRLALEDQANLFISDIEFSLSKPSYTINTIEHLVKINPKKQFVLLMGEDNLIHFQEWKKNQQILALVQAYVYPRNYKILRSSLSFEHKKIKLVKAPKLDYSSKNIRKILREGKSVKDLIPNASWTYLEKNGFYK